MDTLPKFDDDDTGRLGRIVRQKAGDAFTELKALEVMVQAHEDQDNRRWRLTHWVLGLVITTAIAVCSVVWSAHAETSADRARLEDVQSRLVRIETQIDRLMERTAP